jgi:HSP20 family protein
MANVTVHKEGSREGRALAGRDAFNPFRAWRDMLKWDPFAEMLPVLSDEERALFSPDFDVKENKDGFVFTADLPGMESKDIDVKLTDNRLTISGRREQEKEEKGETTYRRERSYGSFRRAFTLPAGVDGNGVKADLKNGVLTVTLSKKAEAKAKQVTVNAK